MTVETRKPRFQRAKTRASRLTSRDLQIIRFVHRHRLLNSTHIEALLGQGSPQQVRRRLHLLFHNGYLDRPEIQVADFYRTPGTLPMVYGLGNKGADLLAERKALERGSIDWTAKNRAIGSRFFHHTLMVSSIMVAFELSCRRHGNVRLIPWEEILRETCPGTTRKKQRPMTWRARIDEVGQMGITPDHAFGLEYSDRPPGRNRSYFFLEADRASMPIFRKSLRDTSVFRKLLVYHATAREKLHEKLFGLPNFRVLTVTRSPSGERVQNMVEAAQRLRGFAGLFLFADLADLEASDALEAPWLNGRGEQVKLTGKDRRAA